MPNWTFSDCFWLVVSLFVTSEGCMQGLIFFLTTDTQGTKSHFEPLPGHFFMFGFCRATASFLAEENRAEIQQKYEGWLPTNISCTLQGFALSDRKTLKILVSNGHNCVGKLSIRLAFVSKRELCFNSSCHCGERLIYTGKRATSVFLCN